MQKAHYIIFHPDYARQEILVQAKAIEGGKFNGKWTGRIWVDAIGNGNEDPFVFAEKWIYSYCHASQLRRKAGQGIHIQPGSCLLFVSGDAAERRILTVDTVFVVGESHEWGKPLQLPLKYNAHQENECSDLWNRHFRFPFCGYHASVTHTYEAKMYGAGQAFSFLPVGTDGARVGVSLSTLSEGLAAEIDSRVRGKYPVLISEKCKRVLGNGAN